MISFTAEIESGFIQIDGLTNSQCWKLNRSGYGESAVFPDSTTAQLTRSPAAMAAALKILVGNRIEIDGYLFDCFASTETQSAAQHCEIVCRTPLWEYQKPAVQFALARRGTLWAAGCGTGKSKMLLDVMHTTGAKRVLILAPKAVVLNWPNEIAAHCLPEFAKYCAVDVGLSVAGRAHEIMAFMGPGGNEGIYVVDDSSAWRESVARLLFFIEWDIIAVDEAHHIRNPENQLSQLCYLLRDRNPQAKCLALTATPLGNNPLSVYGIGLFVAPEVVGVNKWAFDHKHGVFTEIEVPVNPKNRSGPKRKIQLFKRLVDKDAFAAMLSQFAYEIDKKEALPFLPPQIHQRRYVQFDQATRAKYKKLQTELETEFAGKLLTAANAAVLRMRLQQFTGLYKVEAVADALEVASYEPVVVICRFTEDLAIVAKACKKLGLKYLEQSGNKTQWLDFQNGEGDVLGVQIQSGGAGINLTRSSHVICYSHGPSNNDYEQMESRTHRPGQEAPSVTYTHICVADTVDDTIVDALIAGVDLNHAILKSIKTKKAGQHSYAA